MPIYAYKCSSCGHAADVLQKISAEPLSACPACGKSTYAKQLTAPGFQLKGSGWYVTDFKSSAPAAKAENAAANNGDAAPAAPAAKTEGATAAPAPSATPAASTTSPAASTTSPAPAAPASAAGAKG